MKELRLDDYGSVEAFFNQKKQHIPALSVLQGNYPGRVFVDHAESPGLAIVWATGRWMYSAGNISTEQSKFALKLFLQEVVIPECTAQNLKWFEIYGDDSQEWDLLFMGGIDRLYVDKHYESVYELQLEQFNQIEKATPAPANEVLVGIEEYPILPEAYQQLPHVHNKFLEQITAGAAVRLKGQTLSICKNNGFTAGSQYFIDVDTMESGERKKGYATQAAIALISYYLHKGMVPLWETTHENLPSHRLASKLGFIPVEQYPVYAFVLQ